VTIYTLGHSTRTLAELLALLREFSIQLLADIRSFPASRRHPQFNKENLESVLPPSGFEYVWLGKELGGFRKKLDPASPHTALRSPGFRNYADYMMAASDFQDGIARLLDLAATKRLVYMCAELLWWRCHRSLVSDYLTACRGVEVIHILKSGKAEPHRLHSAARLSEDKLIYDQDEQRRLL
jgi:uncharacterized protein (DUF488 family)